MATEAPARPKLRTHMMTDVGVVRDHNEDAAYIDQGMEFFVVADGMGGHAAGEVASMMAVDKVREGLEEARPLIAEFTSKPTDDGRKAIVGLLEQSVRSAHQAVYNRGAAESDKQGMGTTLDVVLLAGAEAFVAHVGDSRTYLVRDGKAAQITTDHTVAEVLVIEGKLSLEEAQISPLRTILVNAIGVAPDVGVEMAHVRLRAGDHLLLCSDGLHDYFPVEQELAEHIKDRDPEAALRTMVDLAKNRGGHDNITGILIEVLEAPAEQAAEDGMRDPFEDTATLDQNDGVPQEVSRDDTLPVEKREEARKDDAKKATAGLVENIGSGDDDDLKSTLRMKPLPAKPSGDKEDTKKKKKRRWRGKKSKKKQETDKPQKDSGESAGGDAGAGKEDDPDALGDTDPGSPAAKVDR
jgi:serine/threonine protein phosphatase PrpC